ncbi:hypothetical protein OBK04_00895 [Empedobacter falsenii]
MLKLPFLGILFLISFKDVLKIEKVVIFSLLASFLVTFIYILKGLPISQNPTEAFNQVLTVYVLTPIMWVCILNYIFEKYPIKTIFKFLNIFMVFGALSVFMAYQLYEAKQLWLLEYIIDNPNMNQSNDGLVEMRLFVYGALIFFIPGFMQLDKIYKSKFKFYLIILISLLASLISGRSALILSVLLGVLFYIYVNKSSKIIKYSLFGIILLLAVNFILKFFGINITNIFLEFYNKLFEGGDNARPEQTKALIEGINNNIFGAGHGVGVDYIRSFKYPWRYENVPFALIYKVSLFGFIIYSIPFIYSLKKYFSLTKKHPYDNYMIIGYVSMLVATFTNPYLESFEFNIFYVLPFIYFIKRDKIFV